MHEVIGLFVLVTLFASLVVDHVGVFCIDRLLIGMRVGVCHVGHQSVSL